MRRLVASDLLPERAGQPVKAVVHVSLAELRALDDSELEDQWAAELWSGGPRAVLRRPRAPAMGTSTSSMTWSGCACS
jgi:hypothetical protein